MTNKEIIKKYKKNNLNAFLHVYDFVEETEKAVTIKDNFATKDAPTTSGSMLLKNFQPGYDADVVKKIKENNIAILAKTNLDELGMGGTGSLSAFGHVYNPLNKDRIVGGSSSGSAASIDNNIFASIGSDTGDSVRRPASFVGKVGFKPSYGSISRFGMFSYSQSLDTVGYFTNNVSDSIEISKILFGKSKYDLTTKEVIKPLNETIKPKKVAVLDIHKDYSKKQNDDFENLINKLTNDGVEVSKISLNKDILELILPVYWIISFAEASSTNSNLTGIHFGNRSEGNDYVDIIKNTRNDKLGKMVKRRFALGNFFLNNENINDMFLKASKIRRIIKNTFNEILEQFDVMIYLSSTIAPKLDEIEEDNILNSILSYSNLVGNPSISIPFSKEKEMPFGLSIDSKIYDDKKLLSIAKYFEDLGEKNE
ncbi:MAG: Asp-tRNA(Asn)/Glu-tRNA(Gln) amidotransferase GatCAB subunit A [Mollicutes bacterium PWAP]|nr:Asp-tRNA(Asn)/Glu-tRNA(Gln) amidotransferase GatCAB subunit A [Mollicutes bacterium PWAP]